VVSVNDAPAELVELSPLPESELIADVFEAADGIRLVSLPSSSARVIPDYSGRLLNAAHPDVRSLLKALPAAAGNPVLRTLIQAYVDIDNMEYHKAASRLRELFQDPQLADKAQLTTSPNLRRYLEKRLEGLTRQAE